MNCTALESIDLPSVTRFGGQVFAGCTSLTSVDLPNVTEIDNFAFMGWAFLRINIGSAVRIIGSCAFYYGGECDIYIEALTPPKLSYNSYYNLPTFLDNATIHVPYESLDAYKNNNSWSDYTSNLVGYDF